MMKKEAMNLTGNNCIKKENGKVVFAEDGRKRVWKEHMKAIRNEKNSLDEMVNVEVVEGPMEAFAMKKVERALGSIKNGKTSGATKIVKEHLAALSQGKQVNLRIANEILNVKNMPHDRTKSTVVPIYKKMVALWTLRAIEI